MIKMCLRSLCLEMDIVTFKQEQFECHTQNANCLCGKISYFSFMKLFSVEPEHSGCGTKIAAAKRTLFRQWVASIHRSVRALCMRLDYKKK